MFVAIDGATRSRFSLNADGSHRLCTPSRHVGDDGISGARCRYCATRDVALMSGKVVLEALFGESAVCSLFAEGALPSRGQTCVAREVSTARGTRGRHYRTARADHIAAAARRDDQRQARVTRVWPEPRDASSRNATPNKSRSAARRLASREPRSPFISRRSPQQKLCVCVCGQKKKRKKMRSHVSA